MFQSSPEWFQSSNLNQSTRHKETETTAWCPATSCGKEAKRWAQLYYKQSATGNQVLPTW